MSSICGSSSVGGSGVSSSSTSSQGGGVPSPHGSPGGTHDGSVGVRSQGGGVPSPHGSPGGTHDGSVGVRSQSTGGGSHPSACGSVSQSGSSGSQPSAPADDNRRLYLAIDEKALQPVGLDVDAEPHLLVFGDGGSGKSALLRAYISEVLRTRTPAEAQILVVDYRRALLGEVPEEYQLHYLTSSAQATPALAELSEYLRGRIPGPDVSPEQLRSRTWWTGAELFLVIDDYDLVVTSQGSPMQPMVDLMAQARDVGLHVALTRRSGGASRALYEPVVQSMRDLSMPGIVLSGSPDEGALIGTVKPTPSRPGRGRMVTRGRGTDVVQTAWTTPRH